MNCKNIKFSVTILLVISLIFCSTSCGEKYYDIGSPQLPSGYIEKTEYTGEGELSQTKLRIYKYDDASKFENNPNFEPVGDRVDEIKHYFEVFANWLEVKGRREELTFDYNNISSEDYVALHDLVGEELDEGYTCQKYDNFNLMLFVVSENNLYDISNFY